MEIEKIEISFQVLGPGRPVIEIKKTSKGKETDSAKYSEMTMKESEEKFNQITDTILKTLIQDLESSDNSPMDLDNENILWNLATDLTAHELDLIDEDHEVCLERKFPLWKEDCRRKIFKELINSIMLRKFGDEMNLGKKITANNLIYGIVDELQSLCKSSRDFKNIV